MDRSQNNEDEEETLNAIIQRIDRHGEVLLGKSVRIGELDKQKSNVNRKVNLTASKQATFSVNPDEDRKNVIGYDRTKFSEVSNNHTDNYNKRRKLFRIRSRSETRKKKLPQTRDCSTPGSRGPRSPSKFDIRIQGPTRELYKFDVDVSPTHKSNEPLKVVKKSSINSVDTEVTQGDNELPCFDGVEVTIRVSENDTNKSTKKTKQRKLLGHESLRLTKPSKHSKATGSFTSYYSHPNRITPSQQKLIDTIMSYIRKRGLSSSLRQHIENLLSMSRESVNDLGISSSDNSLDSVHMESIGVEQLGAKDSTIPLQNEGQYNSKNGVKSQYLKPQKEELRMEAARKTADIISQYSQLSEMFVKKIENLANVGSQLDVAFKPDTVDETSVTDMDLSLNPAASPTTVESSYLNLPPNVNPNLPVDRNIMEAFSSSNRRYSWPTPTFDELPEPMYFGPSYYVPFQSEVMSKKVPDEQWLYYYPNTYAHSVQTAYVPMNSNYFAQPEVHPQYRETDRRSMPPPTHANGRFRFGMRPSSSPLATIPEVDTPRTRDYSDSNIFSEHDDEMLINVFEGLDISQNENDEIETSSDSTKSSDSLSSVPDFVSELIKKNVITSPFENRRKRKAMQVLQNKENQQKAMQVLQNKENQQKAMQVLQNKENQQKAMQVLQNKENQQKAMQVLQNKENQQKAMQVLQNKENQQNVYAGSLNITSPHYKQHRVTTPSAAGVKNVNRTTRNHIDFDNISISPVEYINYRLETTNNINPFTGLINKVKNLEKSSSFEPTAKSAFVDNIIHTELTQSNNNTKQQDVGIPYANEQASNSFKNVFKENKYSFPEADKHARSHLKNVPLENHVEFSCNEDERLSNFNEILKDLDEAEEIMSDSSPEDLQLAFNSLGPDWAGAVLHKTQEVQELNIDCTKSGTSKNMRRSAKPGIKEKNVLSNWKNGEGLTSEKISLRVPVLLSASTSDLRNLKTENTLIKTYYS